MYKITREQAMTIIARAMKITKLESELSTGEIEEILVSFKDGGSRQSMPKIVLQLALKQD